MNAHDPRIIHWRQGEAAQNFGDFLTVLLSKELFLFPRLEADVYRVVGSCIAEWMIWDDLSASGRQEYGRIAYWGCGLRDENPIPPALLERCRFFGARGPLTRDLLGLPKDTPLADPGLLAPLFHRPRPSRATQGKTVCMPHVNDGKSDDSLLALSGADMVLHPVVDNNEKALRGLLDKIASAAFLLTGSLHGAILACAYGVPFAFWDNGHVDIILKWRDFAGSVGIGTVFVKNVKEGVEAHRRIIVPNLKRPRFTPLLDICPFEIKPSVRLRALLLDHPDKGLNFEDAIRCLGASPGEDLANRDRLVLDSRSYRNDVAVSSARQLRTLESELAEERGRRLAAEVFKKEVPALNARLAAADDDLKQHLARNVDLEAQVLALTDAHGVLATRADELESDLEARQTERDTLARRLDEAMQTAEASRSRADDLATRLASIEGAHVVLRDQADKLAAALKSRHAERDALHRELGKLGQMEQVARARADALEAQLAALMDAHAVLAARADELKDVLEARQTERDRLDHALTQSRQGERTSHFRIADMQARLTSLTAERLPLLARIAELEDGVMAQRRAREALDRQLAILSAGDGGEEK